MFFNADRETKDALRNFYRQELENQVKRKQEDKDRKLKEEKEYLHAIQQNYETENQRKHLFKLKQISETMGDYNRLVKQKEDNYNLLRYKEVDNNFNINVLNNLLDNGNSNAVDNRVSNANLCVNGNSSPDSRLNYETKSRINKIEQQQLYKHYLDSQVYFVLK
jgi:hypothetical protein